MKRLLSYSKKVLLCSLLPSIAFASDSVTESEISSEITTEDHNFWLGASLGSALISGDQNLENKPFAGFMIGIRGGAHLSYPDYRVYLNLSYNFSAVPVSAKEEKYKTGDQVPHRITTAFGAFEPSLHRRFGSVDAGPELFIPFGTDVSFAPEAKSNQYAHIFAGVGARFHYKETRSGQLYMSGIQLLKDLDIHGRDVYLMKLNFDIGRPFLSEPKVVTKTINKTVTKIRQEYITDLGITNFETNKASLKSPDAAYLQELATNLATMKDSWTNVLIRSHSDKRGSWNYNQKLAERRAAAISGILTKNGISQKRITTESRSWSEPVLEGRDRLTLSRNRRAEIFLTGKGDMSKIKVLATRLRQKFGLAEL